MYVCVLLNKYSTKSQTQTSVHDEVGRKGEETARY